MESNCLNLFEKCSSGEKKGTSRPSAVDHVIRPPQNRGDQPSARLQQFRRLGGVAPNNQEGHSRQPTNDVSARTDYEAEEARLAAEADKIRAKAVEGERALIQKVAAKEAEEARLAAEADKIRAKAVEGERALIQKTEIAELERRDNLEWQAHQVETARRQPIVRKRSRDRAAVENAVLFHESLDTMAENSLRGTRDQ
jgi:hypothetical protein